jgi:Flp pilus assembly pilin Flp
MSEPDSRPRSREAGVTAIQYAVLAGGVVTIVLAAMSAFHDALLGLFDAINV